MKRRKPRNSVAATEAIAPVSPETGAQENGTDDRNRRLRHEPEQEACSMIRDFDTSEFPHRGLLRAALAIALAFGAFGLWGPTGLAHAGVDARRPASFCGSVKKLGADVLQPDDVSETSLDDVLRALKRISKQAPDQLESSFDTLLGFYDILESSPGDSQRIISEGRKAVRAGKRITKYLKKTCNVDFE
jgi:hypothetical protein